MTRLATAYFYLVLLGTLMIGLGHLAVPFSERVVMAAQVAGSDYASRQLPAFERQPGLITVHVIAGVMFALLIPVQFFRRIRQRVPRIHRLCGWGFVCSAAVTGATGVMVAYVYPFAGRAGVIPNLISGVFLSACVGLAVRAARRREFLVHERWMVRAAALGLGIALSRVYVLFLVRGVGLPASEVLAQAFWLGSGTNLILAELWLQRRYKKHPARSFLAQARRDVGATSA